jgi:hypothetical protein
MKVGGFDFVSLFIFLFLFFTQAGIKLMLLDLSLTSS